MKIILYYDKKDRMRYMLIEHGLEEHLEQLKNSGARHVTAIDVKGKVVWWSM